MRRTLVIGLAETGVAVARALRRDGDEVVVFEDTPSATETYRARLHTMREIGVEVVEAPSAARMQSAAEFDLVVPSPLVRADHVALRAAIGAGVAVRSEIDLAGERSTRPVVAVTGTNGKTTVTTMTAAMLDASGISAIAAGNIGRPLIEAVDDDVDVVVAEVSSFQLAFVTTFRPRVAVLLAITPDHLDWHGSFEQYVAAKARIAENQGDGDLLVFDADNARAAAIAARAHVSTVGVSSQADAVGCYRVVDDALVDAGAREIAQIASLQRALPHDRTNALCAAAAAIHVGASHEGVRAALRAYQTMPHRVALVGEAIGVRWYDDSKATNPDAALRAVSAFESVVLLAGGRNKGLDLSVLAGASPHLRAVVAFGEAGPDVAAAFKGTSVTVVVVDTMRAAVGAAKDHARSGDVVLLSPACASFDAYGGYAARGDDFAAEVRDQVLTGGAA
jgi:UDP-N-acetylmuramoylalanine--D-glutamate ligase